MGNFEKLVVLTVLFLSAVVLAVSLNDDAEGANSQSPLEAARAQLGSAVVGAEPVAGGTHAQVPDSDMAASFLLTTELVRDTEPVVSTVAAPVVPAATNTRSGKLRILRSEEGLAGAGIEDYRVYAVSEGDTWSGLSERFYHGGRYVHHLRSANEEVNDLRAGERILIPVYDFAQEAGQREPYVTRGEVRPTAQPVASTSETTVATRAATTPSVPADVATAGTYTVRPGDSLTKISQIVYGTAARWEVIYKANSVRLESPDWLKVGAELVIPRGGEVQAVAADESAAADTERPKVR